MFFRKKKLKISYFRNNLEDIGILRYFRQKIGAGLPKQNEKTRLIDTKKIEFDYFQMKQKIFKL